MTSYQKTLLEKTWPAVVTFLLGLAVAFVTLRGDVATQGQVETKVEAAVKSERHDREKDLTRLEGTLGRVESKLDTIATRVNDVQRTQEVQAEAFRNLNAKVDGLTR